MAARPNPFGKLRLVYRRTSTPVKCMILAALVVATAALLTLTISIRSAQAKLEAQKQQAALLEQENKELQENIDGLGSVESDKQIAKNELGLVDPNTVLYTPEN